MQERFGVPVGLSDHTLDNTTSIASVALDSCIIEKHVMLDRSGGPDDSFSLEPEELKILCDGVKIAWGLWVMWTVAEKLANKVMLSFVVLCRRC